MITSENEQELLQKIYIGQNIRKEGILRSEIENTNHLSTLLKQGLLKENHWYLYQVLTTNKGSNLGKKMVTERIEKIEEQIKIQLNNIPKQSLNFFIRKFILKKLDFSTKKPYLGTDSWEDKVLSDDRIWILWNKLFTILMNFDLCVKTFYYVSTRNGELRDLHYVISTELQGFLSTQHYSFDVIQNQEDVLRLYPYLRSAKRYLNSDDIDYARQKCYELLGEFSINEKRLAGIIHDMSEKKITSEYNGFLSEKKPFSLLDPSRFDIYLEKNLIEPAIDIILGGEITLREYLVKAAFPDPTEVKMEHGFLDSGELGNFYILISDFERQLREVIKEKLGKGWIKRIENDLPNIFKNWGEKRRKDTRWGIESEKDLINYSDLGDYIEILKKYKRMFSLGDDDMGDIIAHLKIWYNHGRNPIMHARTINKQKYFTSKSAIDFLYEWMNRIK